MLNVSKFITNGKKKTNKNVAIVKQTDSGITWGAWSAAGVVVVVFLLAQLVAEEIMLIYPHLHSWSQTAANNWLQNSVYAQFLYVLLAEVITVSLIFLFVYWRKGKLRSIGLKRPKLIDTAYALTGLFIYYPIYIVAALTVGWLLSVNLNQTQSIGFSGSYSGWQLLIVFISLVILPPIAEEIMFRGFLFSGLKKKLPVIWAALFTSLLFAVPHLLESGSGGLLWIAGIDTFILSMVLCWLRQATGRLYAGMGLHALKNFIAFATLYLLHSR
jgi:membrane protease YdiL (CAAX protease family)